ncbi:MAG: hypothetical protein ACM34N_10065 [Ignavibacteria bacterium]
MKECYQRSLFLFVSLIFAYTVVSGNASKNGELIEDTKNLTANDLVPCELLTAEQVETVLPGSDEGYTAASGNSLMEGVKSYQCSYNNDKYDLFTVIIHIASSEKDFEWIKPKKSIRESYEDAKKLQIGDGGWLYGNPDDMKVEVAKGFSVIQLELSSDKAKEKGNALIELAAILVKKIK